MAAACPYGELMAFRKAQVGQIPLSSGIAAPQTGHTRWSSVSSLIEPQNEIGPANSFSSEISRPHRNRLSRLRINAQT